MTIQFKPKTGARGIEWCDLTLNPIGGCLHDCHWVMPDGTVAMCYAKNLAENGVAKSAYPHGFEHHYWRPHMLKKLTGHSDPQLIFVDSMSDLFGSWVEEDHLVTFLNTMADFPKHTFQALTKAPGRLHKYAAFFPHNLWVGVSSAPDRMNGKALTSSQQMAYMRHTLNTLTEIKEKTGNLTWMSLEPVSWDMAHLFTEHTLDWVTIGAASNGRQYFQPDHKHIENLLDVFDRTNTPVFFKGNIRPLIETTDWPWREDFPAYYANGSPIPAVFRREERAEKFGWTKATWLLTCAICKKKYRTAFNLSDGEWLHSYCSEDCQAIADAIDLSVEEQERLREIAMAARLGETL